MAAENGHKYGPVENSSLRLLFSEQQRFLNHFFDTLDFKPIEEFCKACLNCKGCILFTGVGKSGFVAQKITQTLVSTGTKAIFLSPTDALHGDIGIVSEGDLVVAFSKSGATEELIKLLPYAKAKGAILVSVTSLKGCKLEQLCDMAIHLPLMRELCPFDLAPVTSTAIQMLFGDTVAIALMQAKNLTKDQYAMNHPAGRIGKRLILRVTDVMLKASELPTVQSGTTVADALMELTTKGLGFVLVMQGSTMAGAFTDGDLRRALQRHGSNALPSPIDEVMTTNPRWCSSDIKAIDAMQDMEKAPKVNFLAVIEDGALVGAVTLHLLVSAGL